MHEKWKISKKFYCQNKVKNIYPSRWTAIWRDLKLEQQINETCHKGQNFMQKLKRDRLKQIL